MAKNPRQVHPSAEDEVLLKMQAESVIARLGEFLSESNFDIYVSHFRDRVTVGQLARNYGMRESDMKNRLNRIDRQVSSKHLRTLEG